MERNHQSTGDEQAMNTNEQGFVEDDDDAVDDAQIDEMILTNRLNTWRVAIDHFEDDSIHDVDASDAGYYCPDVSEWCKKGFTEREITYLINARYSMSGWRDIDGKYDGPTEDRELDDEQYTAFVPGSVIRRRKRPEND